MSSASSAMAPAYREGGCPGLHYLVAKDIFWFFNWAGMSSFFRRSCSMSKCPKRRRVPMVVDNDGVRPQFFVLASRTAAAAAAAVFSPCFAGYSIRWFPTGWIRRCLYGQKNEVDVFFQRSQDKCFHARRRCPAVKLCLCKGRK